MTVSAEVKFVQADPDDRSSSPLALRLREDSSAQWAPQA